MSHLYQDYTYYYNYREDGDSVSHRHYHCRHSSRRCYIHSCCLSCTKCSADSITYRLMRSVCNMPIDTFARMTDQKIQEWLDAFNDMQSS